MQSRRFTVRGRVQGVGFRWFVREQAHELGLHGYVQNVADGSVLVVAGGPEDAMARLRERLSAGPVGAVVQGVDEIPALPSDLPLRFPFGVER